MKTMLAFDFSVDKENSSIHVKREFAADLKNVWAAWTRSELLDLWWAPRPYQTRTRSMDFREGGSWFYSMVGPTEDEHYCRADYKKIEPLKSYSGLDAFCDKEGNINTDFPRSLWTVKFADQGEHTLVDITIKYEKLEDLEKIVSLGFKEGFTMAMGNLDEYFEGQS